MATTALKAPPTGFKFNAGDRVYTRVGRVGTVLDCEFIEPGPAGGGGCLYGLDLDGGGYCVFTEDYLKRFPNGLDIMLELI